MALPSAVPFATIELIAQPRGSAMRWAISEGLVVEVWLGTQLLGTLSGETLRQLVAKDLSTVALMTRAAGELSRPEAASLPSPPPCPPVRAPSKDMLTPEGQAARRQARRSRQKPA